MEQRLISKQRRHLALAALALAMGSSVLQGCKDDDVLTGQPSWLGNSIYERLAEDGHYTTMLRLIDDLGQYEVLSHTGSKTLFAANDSAFDKWYVNNSWGVSRYDQLSLSQKKLLLNNSMVNNAYLIELLSNVRGTPPMEGMCMRRETATSIYDSVQILTPAKMPNTAAWLEFKNRGKSIPLLKDASAAPMIHFLPAFMKMNKITVTDLEILTNRQANDINEAWVNGKKVVERDITCKNGYIQKVGGVIESSPNMAEIIRQHPSMSMWSHLLDRFSAPYFSAAATREYNRLYNNEDSVYVLRYYNDQSDNSNTETPNGESVKAVLKFDPGWNQYMYTNTMDYDLHYDAGAMIVPTNAALEAWWNNEGKDLQMEYGSWDSIPDATLSKLIRVNMLPVFTEAVPSKFKNVLNDAKEELGIKIEHIDSCFMGCNGVVYMTNRVFTPAEYSAVSYPALAHTSTMSIIYWAIDHLNFLPYLLSMDSQYSLLLPTNDAMLLYVDPASFGQSDNSTGMEIPDVIQFYWDPLKRYQPANNVDERVQAYRYRNCTVDEFGNIVLNEDTREVLSNRDIIEDRMKRLMDQLIIVGDIQDGHEYYKSKGGTPIRVFRAPDGRLAFAGGWQIEHNNKPLAVNDAEIYTKTNGKSYQLNEQMPISAQNSVYMTLEEREEFSEFLELLDNDGADLLTSKLRNKYNAGLINKGNKNLRLFDNYNYTVYVPTNSSIRKLIDDGLLPTWEDYEEQTDSIWGTEEAAEKARAVIKDIIVSFLRYHIQDHAVGVDMAPEDGKYVNNFESMRRNLETGRFYPITVNNGGGEMTVTDIIGNTRNVVKKDGLYNRICREYWYNVDNSGTPTTTYMASDAIVHQIDGVLFYENMTPWRNKLNKIRRK